MHFTLSTLVLSAVALAAPLFNPAHFPQPNEPAPGYGGAVPAATHTWNGKYNDQWDDSIRGVKTVSRVMGTPCDDATDSTHCGPISSTGASKYYQCHRGQWMILQCDYGFNCAIDQNDAPLYRPHCVSHGH
ncbi:hypothetical protein HDU98_004679 [Podochytrium sp. JEL0797]|nr:hypothetical protein HDU98_004679 [Podochytrium sp. JEL0797]